MFRFITETYHRLIENLDTSQTRYLYHSLFEIGGKNKTRDQLRELKEPTYLVKNDILQPLKGEIPLFLLGFLY